MGSNGRTVIPARIRRALGISDGTDLVLRVVDDEVRITTVEAAVRRAQALVRRYVPADRSLVDELIAERRNQARRE